MHRAPSGTLTTGRTRKRICAALLIVFLIVIVVWLGSFLGQGGGSSGDSESDNSTFTTEEFITDIDHFESTSTSRTSTSTSKDEDTVKPAREEEARDREPCLTKSGLLCKSWVYFGYNVSG